MTSLIPEADESQSILEGNFDFILDEIIVNSNIHHCHLCPQKFLTKMDFKSHLKNHGQQDRFSCPHCSHSYLTSTKLWSHMSRSHFKSSTGKGFYCSLCDNKAFKQAFNYHLHMLIHLGEQPEKCRFCAKAFRTKPSLRKHELIHTGHKRHKCSECNSCFKTKDELKQHGISHTTGKPYRCDFCSVKFKYQASLKRHEKKGRCKIGKHWCPDKRRSEPENQVDPEIRKSPAHSSSGSDDADSECNLATLQTDQQPLFCDVFLGWETTCSNIFGTKSTNNLLSNNPFVSSSTSSATVVTEPLFSF